MITPGNICDNCNFKYQLDNANTVIYYYECQPWFSFGWSICPACQSVYTDSETGEREQKPSKLFFTEQHSDYMEYFILHDFGFITEDFAPESLVAAYEDLFNLKPIPQLADDKLIPRHEQEARALYAWLMSAPDEWIMAVFEEPAPPNERPEMWQ